jgi:hypothetical protein
MNSSRTLLAFRKEFLNRLEVKTAKMFLLLDLKFQTVIKISTKISSDNIQGTRCLNASLVPKV